MREPSRCARSTDVQLGKSWGCQYAEPDTQPGARLRSGAMERRYSNASRVSGRAMTAV